MTTMMANCNALGLCIQCEQQVDKAEVESTTIYGGVYDFCKDCFSNFVPFVS